MRRAVLATVGTVIGLAALLSYKSSGTVQLGKVSLVPGGPTSSGAGITSAPTTLGPSPATTSGPAGTAQRTYAGQDVNYLYGSIQVDVTVKGARIVGVTVPQNVAVDPRSQMINSEAVPILIQEAEQAQSLNFDVVSGATFTSDAFAQSLQTALRQVKK